MGLQAAEPRLLRVALLGDVSEDGHWPWDLWSNLLVDEMGIFDCWHRSICALVSPKRHWAYCQISASAAPAAGRDGVDLAASVAANAVPTVEEMIPKEEGRGRTRQSSALRA